MEEVKWSTVEKDMMAYDVTMPYIRMMAGPVDYTPGAMRNASRADFKPVYRDPMSQGTRCHQLAAYIIHDSPLTMLADAPSAYRREPECTDFIAAIPTDGFRQTRVLQGELGAYIVTARQTADGCWYVGGMTDWTPRNVTLHYDFWMKARTRSPSCATVKMLTSRRRTTAKPPFALRRSPPHPSPWHPAAALPCALRNCKTSPDLSPPLSFIS